MSLELKGENNDNQYQKKEPAANPWDYENMREEPFQTTVNTSSLAAEVHGIDPPENHAKNAVMKVVILLAIGFSLVLICKLILLMQKGKDITDYLRCDEAAIASELKLDLLDRPEMVGHIHQWSTGEVSVKGTEDFGVVYIDGKQAGIHVESKKYTMYGLQLGEGEKHAYENMSYDFEDFHAVLNDMAEGKTTTYYYYNTQKNDCIAMTINDTTCRIVGLTYFYDYQKVIETLTF